MSNINSVKSTPSPSSDSLELLQYTDYSIPDPLDDVLTLVREILSAFVAAPAFSENMKLVFGETAVSHSLNTDWLSQSLGNLPTIKILTSDEMNGANGAFSTEKNTIYLKDSFIQSQSNYKISQVLLEELGHKIDSTLNEFDTFGDEGEMFSRLVLGQAINEQLIQQIQQEDDTGFVQVDGENIQVERATGNLRNLIKNGLNNLLTRIETVINEQVYASKLPLIGDELKDLQEKALKFISEFRKDIDKKLDELESDTEEGIQEALVEVLGNDGLKILQDVNGDDKIDKDDVKVSISSDNSNFQFKVAQDFDFFDAKLAADIGLPNLGYTIDGEAKVGIGYELDLDFGVDAVDGDETFYLNADKKDEVKINLGVTLPNLDATSKLGFFELNATDKGTAFTGTFNVDLLDDKDDDDTLLRLDELPSIDSRLSAKADINLALSAGTIDLDFLPSWRTDFNLVWEFDEDTYKENNFQDFGDITTLAFKNIRLDLGSFFDEFAGPVLERVQQVTEPLQPLVDFLYTEIDLKFDEFTPLDLLERADEIDDEDRKLIESIAQIVNLVNNIPSSDVQIPLGGFDLNNEDPRSNNFGLSRIEPRQIEVENPFEQILEGKDDQKDFFNIADGAGLKFEILKPKTLYDLILGKEVDLFTYDAPKLEIDGEFERSVIIKFVTLGLFAKLKAGIDIDFGFDTFGLKKYQETGKKSDIFDGFYVDDTDKDNPEAYLDFSVGAFAEVGINFYVVRAGAGVEGAIKGDIDLDIRDPNEDGKVRWNELREIFQSSPLDWFDTSGRITAELNVYAKACINTFLYKKCWTIFNENLISEILLDFEKESQPPVLATNLGLADLQQEGVLRLNMGPNSAFRQTGDLTDGSENFLVSSLSEDVTDDAVSIVAFGEQQEYSGVNKVIADGGQGNDVIRMKDSISISVEFSGGDGSDLLAGGSGDDILKGDNGVDRLYGADGDDSLFGGADDDFLIGGSGADTFDGGDGDDTVSYLTSETGIFLDLSTGDATGEAVGDSFSSIEQINGSSHSDTLIGDDQDNVFLGAEGADKLFGKEGDDLLNGSEGDDELIGDLGDDILIGWDGRDTLIGGEGRDLLIGDTGSSELDRLTNESNDDWLRGEAGNDILNGGSGKDILDGGLGDDELTVDKDDIFSRLDGGEGIDIVNIDASSRFHLVLTDRNRIESIAGNLAANEITYQGTQDISISGGGDNDTITGGDGNDEIEGGDDGDSLFGGEGQDLLRGDAGNDRLYGQDDDDILFGLKGDDQLDGGDGNDQLDGGTGNDRLVDNLGDDTYIFGRDYGVDTVYLDYTLGSETVRFKSGITPSDVTFFRKSDDRYDRENLYFAINNTHDRLIIDRQFRWSSRGVEKFAFADGTIWDIAEIKAQLLQSTDQDDRIFGYYNEDNRLDGGAGNDFLDGYSGENTYVFGKGYGTDTISITFNSSVDTLLFKPDIMPSDLVLRRETERGGTNYTLYIDVKGTDDQLIIETQFKGDNYNVDKFVFSDGTIWSAKDVENKLLESTEGDDYLIGYRGGSILDGGKGNDLLESESGENTFVFGRDYGVDTLLSSYSSEPNTLSIKAGVDLSDILFWRTPDDIQTRNNLYIGIKNTSDRLIIEDQFFSNNYGIDQIVFADGTVVTRADLNEMSLPESMPGDDTLIGDDSSNLLESVNGNDILEGGAGDDTYIFKKEYGQDTIREFSDSNNNFDVVRFGAELTPNTMSIVREGNDLVFKVNGSNDRLTIKNQFDNPRESASIEEFQFDSGSIIWTKEDIKQYLIELNSTDGDDIIVGYSEDDSSGIGDNSSETLDGGLGNDILRGGTGDDTYIFDYGYGRDLIEEDEYVWDSNYDTVRFGVGLTFDTMKIVREGNDLVFNVNGSNDRLTIRQQFNNPNEALSIEEFQFDGGSITWTKEDIKQYLIELNSTDGDDIIVGYSEDDSDGLGDNSSEILDGGLGNDILKGGTGDDTYIFNSGYGQDLIEEDEYVWDSNYDIVKFGAGLNPDTMEVVREDDTLIFKVNNSNDRLTINRQFNYFSEAYSVEEFQFDAGETIWTKEDVKQYLLDINSTNGDDYIIGYSWGEDDDTLDGGVGYDILEGGFGDDTYIFKSGYGKDIIREDSRGTNSYYDTVRFGVGLTPDTLEILRQGEDLIFRLKGEDDELTIERQFSIGEYYAVEEFQFDDGAVIWTKEDVKNAATTVLPTPALVATAFDVTNDHLPTGEATLTFTLENEGSADATDFEIGIVHSNDDIIGNADDVIIETLTINRLASGQQLSQTITAQLSRETLNKRALADDVTGLESGHISGSYDYLGVVIDPNNLLDDNATPEDSPRGKDINKDDFTYFPWDIDGNGLVSPTDAIFVINRLGQSVQGADVKADFDGNGSITPTDAIAVINRLGYSINPDVFE